MLSNVTHNYLSPTPPPLDKGNIVKFVVQHHTRVIYHQHDPSMEATTLTSLLDITRERTPTNKQHDSSKEVTSSNPLINAAHEHLSPAQLLDGGEPQGQSLLFSMTQNSTHNIRAPKTIKPRITPGRRQHRQFIKMKKNYRVHNYIFLLTIFAPIYHGPP